MNGALINEIMKLNIMAIRIRFVCPYMYTWAYVYTHKRECIYVRHLFVMPKYEITCESTYHGQEAFLHITFHGYGTATTARLYIFICIFISTLLLLCPLYLTIFHRL